MPRKLKIAGFIIAGLVILVVVAAIYLKMNAIGHSSPVTPSPITPTGDRVLDSIARGVELLKAYQEPDGHFSRGALDPKPAFTAMAVEAIISSPNPPSADEPWMAKAIEAILALQQPDGGIYTPRVPIGNYCTAVSIMALVKADKVKYATQIEKAARYIMGIQNTDSSDPDSWGGYGYFPSSRSDLSNTVMAVEALRDAGVPPDSPAIQLAVKFLSRCQNNSETNPLEWVMNDGGFIYRPAESKAGTVTTASGGKGFKSYGLMTYAGLLAMAYANLDPGDPRVTAALGWVGTNYSVAQNPGLGDAGLFYYYRTMAKALATTGKPYVDTAKGPKNWASDIADAIISRQLEDGSWSNENSEWLEDDSVLVTAYCVRALSYCRELMEK